MAIASALQRFVDDELGRTPALIERVLAGTLQLLRDNQALPAAERAQAFVLIEALQTRGAACQREFVASLSRGVGDALAEQQGIGLGDARGENALELMDESRVEIDIEISRAMQLIDTTAEWELRELQTFTSTLVGQSYVTAESNPLRPLVYASALWQATSAVSPVQTQRATLLRLSAGVIAGLLKKAWAAACTRLESQGIEPGIYRTVVFAPGAHGSAATPGQAPGDANRSGALAGLLATMPAGSAGMQVGVANAALAPGSATPRSKLVASAEFEQALARLDEVLRHLPTATTAQADVADALNKRLGLHHAALSASASGPAERQVIELVTRVFAAIRDDPRVSAPFASLLARLQASALRLALRDPQVCASTQHPLWLLLDAIATAAAGYPQSGDARVTDLHAFGVGLLEPLQRAVAPSAGDYRRALQQLEAFLAEQLRVQLQAAQASVQTLQAAERREMLEQHLSKRLTDQMAPLRAPPAVRRFMAGAWSRVLALAMTEHGDQAEVTRGYIKVVDELLWSVQLPDHPQSRQRLIALLPGMLTRLRAGMASIRLPANEQDAFLDELVAIHTEALRPGRAESAAALTPEQIVQRMRDEEILPASTGHGGFSDSVIDLASMETVPAELMPTQPAGDDAAARSSVDALRPGDRRRLFVHGRWSRVQLLWRSDFGQFFLFAGETVARTHSVTHRALERLAAAGLLEALEAKPLVQRALDRVAREANQRED